MNFATKTRKHKEARRENYELKKLQGLVSVKQVGKNPTYKLFAIHCSFFKYLFQLIQQFSSMILKDLVSKAYFCEQVL